MNKYPLGQLTQAKIRASRRAKRFGQKLGIKYKKKPVHPASCKPEREACAKKGIPVDRKPERAVQEKVRELRRMTMSRWIILQTIFSIDQSASPRRQVDKTLRDMKAIAEWEPHGITSHGCLFLCINFHFFTTTFSYQNAHFVVQKRLIQVNTKIFL